MRRFPQLERVKLGQDYSLQWPPAPASVRFGNTVLNGWDMVPGTGQTLNELLELGYTIADVQSMLEQGAASGLINAPTGGTQAGPFQSISIGGKVYSSNDVVPGTGVTVGELRARGYSESDIATFISASDAANAAAAATTQQAGGLPPGPSPRISTAGATSVLDSAMNWLQGSSLISGVPNFALLAGGVLAFSLISGGGRRRRR